MDISLDTRWNAYLDSLYQYRSIKYIELGDEYLHNKYNVSHTLYTMSYDCFCTIDLTHVRYVVSSGPLPENPLLIPVRSQQDMYVYIGLYHHPEMKYLDLLSEVYHYGKVRDEERTKTGTRSLFYKTLSIDLLQGYFPIQDTRKTPAKTIWREVLWYLSGSTDVTELQANGIHIWDGNTSRAFLDANGLSHLEEWDIGATYGYQIRHCGSPYPGKRA